jgi:hypothetical protein
MFAFDSLWRTLTTKRARTASRKVSRRGAARLVFERLENREVFNAAFSFDGPTLIGTGGLGSYRSVLADFGGDGKLDLAVANQNGGDVSILMGDGQGQFATSVKYPTGGSMPVTLLALDVNRDNHPDLVAGDVNGPLSVLMNDGHGGFGAPTTYTSGGYNAICLAAADLNGDGFSDIAVTHSDWSNPNVAVLFSDGNGGFGTPATYPIPGGIVGGVAIGDFNSDDRPDLVVISDMADGTARLLLNNGDGTFTAAGAFADGGWRSSMAAVGDLNGDGHDDVVVGNLDSQTVGVLLGDGQGGFQPVTTYTTGGYWAAIPTLADLNGDGKTDLVINNQFSNTLAVLEGNGQGGFASPIVMTTGGSQPGTPSVGDLNSDGQPDIVAANYDNGQVAVFLNTTPLTTQQRAAILINQVNALVASGSLNNGNGNALTTKLTAATNSLNAGNKKAGVNQVNAFINQVEAIARSRKLTAFQAKLLIDIAEEAINGV